MAVMDERPDVRPRGERLPSMRRERMEGPYIVNAYQSSPPKTPRRCRRLVKRL